MANAEHLEILKQGVQAWNHWRAKNREIRPDLSEAHLDGAILTGANLRRVDLRQAKLWHAKLNEAHLTGADLRQAHLGGASLRKTSLRGADLREAYLDGANLREANLREANLREAYLCTADLTGANLRQADLTGANLYEATAAYTSFGNVDLSTVKRLETIKHKGPSTIGVDTIYISKGKIPAVFLRGAGIPDNFIEYMSSLIGTAFQFYSCFISYSGKDQEFADRLYADLQRDGVRCWFAPHDVQAGKKLHEQIDNAIRLHERLLLILSPDSINSEWVKDEIARARKREVKEGRRVLFPIRLSISFEELQDWECFDADRGKDSAREIREYYIPDFTRWKDHDQYQKEFKKLLRDLKKETAIAASAAGSGQ